MSSARRSGAANRAARSAHLAAEVRGLRRRLAEAEATLRAIGSEDVDARAAVTRERKAESGAAAGSSAAAYEHFLEAMRDGALSVDEAGVVLHASQRMLQLAGRESLVGCSALELFHDAAGLRTVLQNAGGRPSVLGTTLLRGDGSRIAVELSASVLPLPGPRRIGIVVTVPVARSGLHRIAASEAADPRRDDLDRLLAQLPTGILIVDAVTGYVVYANRQAAELFGRPLLGTATPISHVELACWHADGTIVESEQTPVARVLRGELVVRQELARARPDGTLVHTRTTAAPVLDENGDLESVLLAVEDASEAYVARVERDANERFRELFIGILGHDLRDPLSALVAGAALLQRRGGLTTQQSAVVDRMASSADRMVRMVNQILDFTRSRIGGGIPLERRRVRLADVVGRVVADLHASHKERRIETTFDGFARGHWDPDRLEQVVSNLVSNALTHGSGEAPVQVHVGELHEAARLEVFNDGAPIPPDLLPNLFDPFRRAATYRNQSGLGLGLYIAQQIVHAHGGTLTVDSSAERGTTFVVVLPLA